MFKKMDTDLMRQCDSFLLWRKERGGYPEDFDDIAWVMHDFVMWLRGQLEDTEGLEKTNG